MALDIRVLRRKLLFIVSLFILVGLFVITLSCTKTVDPLMSLEERLETLQASEIKQITDTLVFVSDLGVVNIDNVFEGTYEIYLIQPLDHNNPDSETFEQKIYISYVDPYAPVVIVTEGYYTGLKVAELTALLKCNQIIIEHRYFGDSKPDPIDWQYLNTFQASADISKIVDYFKPVFKGTWLSTGISKGGSTALYHGYYFPETFDIIVPYVAPISLSKVNEPIYDFLDNIGTEDCRSIIFEFQKLLLENKNEIYPLFLQDADSYGWTYERAGGPEIAYELAVLGYVFRFWQYGKSSCEEIPLSGSIGDIYDHFQWVADLGWNSDQEIVKFEPYFYQAFTEFGYFEYRYEKFEGLLDYVPASELPSFYFKAPQGVELVFDYGHNIVVCDYLAHEADNIIFIYGSYDPWTAAAVELYNNTNSFVVMKEAGDHGTNIFNMDVMDQEFVLLTLAKWLNYDYEEIFLNASEVYERLHSGLGFYRYTSGSTYEGEFKDGKFHGSGTFTYADGSQYIGEFKEDMAHGQGTRTYANGDKYVGEHKDDMRHGHGTYTFADGSVLTGRWANSEYIGP